MADFARFLPLNGRPHGDETDVTSDRRVAVAQVIDEAQRLLGGVDAERAGRLAADFVRAARLDADPVDGLPALSASVRTGKRRSIRSLVHATRALLVLAAETGGTPRLHAAITGAVALWGATSGPFDRRAVLKGHTIAATDEEWSFGRGPVLAGPALGIVAFVLALSDQPPVASTLEA
ncbi:hypothetical protein [Microbacterium terricola]|uniref:Uncharacterized protein n=1 Tax=Microbacterium terricola TaxID=344163 RepID=A0ABM8DZQ9_9MICO|nr:hypothetical protein [Microbacterium terricola]UYK41083.1 hypothetical protein OAU46_05405 [Microbacterium terricola]BDV31158.1 hypothetical protein Microterr_18180 [Microbacterium terricola]